MKIARTYTLDQEMVEKLVNINASDLINRLLREHFEAYSPKNTLLDEKQAIIKQVLKKKDRFLKKSRSLKSGMHSILITIQKFGSELVKKSLQLMKYQHTSTTEASQTQQKISKEDGSSAINSESCSND